MRVFDLRCPWLWQYASETTVFDAGLYREIPGRLARLSGYLQGTSFAVLNCGRKPEDWRQQRDAWSSMLALLALIEAEFSGRLWCNGEDIARWRAEPAERLCWGIAGVAGLDFLAAHGGRPRPAGEVARARVRVFGLVETESNALAGSTTPGDDRGLSDLGRAVLSRLRDIANEAGPGARPSLDLAGLNTRSTTEVLDWIEHQSFDTLGLSLIHSQIAAHLQCAGALRDLTTANLTRLRGFGGLVGLSPSPVFFEGIDAFRAGIEAIATIPFEGRQGYEGIAISADFLGLESILHEMRDVGHIADEMNRIFPAEIAKSLLSDNGLQHFSRGLAAV